MNGIEWVVEAHGCREDLLRSSSALRDLFRDLIELLDLHPVAETQWHQFPKPAGITGLCLLTESHIACHTFPEFGSLCLNVFCCKPRPDCDFEACLRDRFQAEAVTVRKIERHYSLAATGATALERGSH